MKAAEVLGSHLFELYHEFCPAVTPDTEAELVTDEQAGIGFYTMVAPNTVARVNVRFTKWAMVHRCEYNRWSNSYHHHVVHTKLGYSAELNKLLYTKPRSDVYYTEKI